MELQLCSLQAAMKRPPGHMHAMSWRCRNRSDPFPLIGATMFARRNVLMGTDSTVPPDALGLFAVFGEQDFKTAFAIVTGLLPGALPESVGKICGDESSVMLSIGTVAGFIQRGRVTLIVLDFEDLPFTAQIGRGRGAVG